MTRLVTSPAYAESITIKSLGTSLRLSHLNVTCSTFNVLQVASLVHVLLHFTNTTDRNGHMRMPLWLNMHSPSAFNAERGSTTSEY